MFLKQFDVRKRMASKFENDHLFITF